MNSTLMKTYNCKQKVSFMGGEMNVDEALEKILKVNLDILTKTRGKNKVSFKKFFKDEKEFISMCSILKNASVFEKGILDGQLYFRPKNIIKALTKNYLKKKEEENKIKNKQKKRLIKFIEQRNDGDIQNLIDDCSGIIYKLNDFLKSSKFIVNYSAELDHMMEKKKKKEEGVKIKRKRKRVRNLALKILLEKRRKKKTPRYRPSLNKVNEKK